MLGKLTLSDCFKDILPKHIEICKIQITDQSDYSVFQSSTYNNKDREDKIDY